MSGQAVSRPIRLGGIRSKRALVQIQKGKEGSKSALHIHSILQFRIRSQFNIYILAVLDLHDGSLGTTSESIYVKCMSTALHTCLGNGYAFNLAIALRTHTAVRSNHRWNHSRDRGRC